MPKISVIIPVYGVERYIERCAVSLFEQTIDDIEFIFIDDCSPDCSVERLKRVLSSYPHRNGQVKIERMPINSGLAAVRKYGVGLAMGEYLIACDSDDYVERDMYEKMYICAVEGDYDLVQCDIDIVDDEGVVRTLSSDKESYTSDELRTSIIEGRISNSLCNKLVKRDVYLNDSICFPQYGMDEDNTMAVQLAICSKKLNYIRVPFYKAYYNSSSISHKPGLSQTMNRFNESLFNSRILVDFLSKHNYTNNDLPMRVAKVRPKLIIWPVLTINSLAIWKRTYPEIDMLVIRDKRFSFHTRIKFMLALSFLYPLYNTFKIRDHVKKATKEISDLVE